VPFVLLIFAVMQPRRAVIFSYINRLALSADAFHQAERLARFEQAHRHKHGNPACDVALDIRTLLNSVQSGLIWPMLLWCLEPYMTSSRMHLGTNDGLINVITQCSIWAFPISLGGATSRIRGRSRNWPSA